MGLAIDYEVIEGIKCMTIYDVRTDTAVATWQGEEVDRILEKMVAVFAEEINN